MSAFKFFEIAQLARLSRSRMVLYSVIFAMAASSLLVAGMDYLLHGQVSFDYLLTGFVTSLCVSALVSSLLMQLTGIQNELTRSQSESIERMALLEQQQEANNLLQTIIETLPIRVFWKDRDLRYLGCNSLFAQDAGLDDLNDILGKNDFQLSWKDHAVEYRNDDQLVIDSNVPKLAFEEPQTTPNGKKILLRTSKTPLRNANGETIGILGIYEDITTLKEIEKEIWLTQTAIAKSSSSFYRIDSQGIILYVNDHVCQALGYEREEIIGQPVWHFAPDFPAEAWPSMWEKLKQQGHVNIETRHRRKDGSIFPVEIVGNYIEHDGEELSFTFVQDISERKRIDQRLRLTQFAMDNASIGIYWIDQNAHISYANQHACDMLGYSQDQLLNLSLAEIDPVYPFDQWHSNRQAVQTDQTQVFETQHTHRDGHILIVEIIANHVQFGDTEYGVAFVNDITERRQAEDKLQLAARVFNEAHEGIMVTDSKANIVNVNPTFCEITGYSHEEALGKNPRFLNSGRQSDEFFAEMWHTLAKQNYWQGEMWNRRKAGEIYAELLTISVLRDPAGNIMHYIGLFSDITQNKHHQYSLERMAHYDPLTQLPNRTLYADRFQQAIARSKRDKTLLAICFVDLDGFKPVNDNYGHEAGDQILIEVAQRIKATLREEDTVSRLGGDEFALLLGDLESVEHCRQAMMRIHQAIAEPYWLDGHNISIAASSGVTIYPLDDSDPDTLLRHADHAMYQAKLAGKNCFRLFDAAHDHQLIEQHSRLQAINDAFERSEFCLYCQPKVNMHSGAVIGVEMLIRWRHPQHGLLLPAHFLPLIESTPLEISIGNWVIDQALDHHVYWMAQGLTLEISVNISSYHLLDEDFIPQLEASLARHPQASPQNLQLEILESSALGDLNSVSDILKTCRDRLGIKIALDDFGTGYSSLTHLRHLPASSVKIDQSFVRDMLEDSNDYAIIEGVIGLANAFHREVIAEGVESKQHGLSLLMLNCQLAQGYGIARPMPADAIVGWISNYQAYPEWLAYVPEKK